MKKNNPLWLLIAMLILTWIVLACQACNQESDFTSHTRKVIHSQSYLPVKNQLEKGYVFEEEPDTSTVNFKFQNSKVYITGGDYVSFVTFSHKKNVYEGILTTKYDVSKAIVVHDKNKVTITFPLDKITYEYY